MRAEEIKAWKTRLLEELDRIEHDLKVLREATDSTTREGSGELSSYSSHMADLGTDTMEREKAFLLASQKRQRRDEVMEALRRIDEGTFGVCEACGQTIPERRLERMPTASLCVPCKEKQEKQAS